MGVGFFSVLSVDRRPKSPQKPFSRLEFLDACLQEILKTFSAMLLTYLITYLPKHLEYLIFHSRLKYREVYLPKKPNTSPAQFKSLIVINQYHTL